MAFCELDTLCAELELPRDFAELEGLLQADLRAIVVMLSERAHDRLRLTRRERQQLQADLWNGLAEVINSRLQPLSIENR